MIGQQDHPVDDDQCNVINNDQNPVPHVPGVLITDLWSPTDHQ